MCVCVCVCVCRYEALKRKISGYLASGAEEGLIHHKSPLSQRKIASKLSSGGFVLYPTSRAEVVLCSERCE